MAIMVKTGAKPEKAVEKIKMKNKLKSTAGEMMINSSPILKGAQIAVNRMAQSGYFESIKAMAKDQSKQDQ